MGAPSYIAGLCILLPTYLGSIFGCGLNHPGPSSRQMVHLLKFAQTRIRLDSVLQLMLRLLTFAQSIRPERIKARKVRRQRHPMLRLTSCLKIRKFSVLRRLLAIVQHPHYLHPLVVERFLWLRSRRWCIQPGKTTVLTCPASQFRITFHLSTYHSALTST